LFAPTSGTLALPTSSPLTLSVPLKVNLKMISRVYKTIPVNGQLMKFVFHIGKSCSNISQIYVSSLAVQQAGLRALSVSSVTHHHHRCHHSHHLSPPHHLYYSQCLSRAFSWMPLRSPV